MNKWKPYSPTFTGLGGKAVKLPNGKVQQYYRRRLRIVTTSHEYKQEGKTVKTKASFKQLSYWQSIKFILRTWATRTPV